MWDNSLDSSSSRLAGDKVIDERFIDFIGAWAIACHILALVIIISNLIA